MIVDSSVVLAILSGEPDARRHAAAIMGAYPGRMSVAIVLEASIAVERRGGDAATHDLHTLIGRAEIESVPVTLEHPEAARRAWRRFGKGNQPAALNFGDCFAYALARMTGEPLLLKGEVSPRQTSTRCDWVAQRRASTPAGRMGRRAICTLGATPGAS